MSDTVKKALQEVQAARPWPAGLVEWLERSLVEGTDQDLFRMNPLQVAQKTGASEADAIDLMLFSTRAGLLEMQWNLICPYCHMAVDSFATLRKVAGGFYCAVCKSTAKTNLDDQVQVSFTVTPRTRKIRFHDPLSLSAMEYLQQYRYSTPRFAADGRPMRDLMAPHILLCSYLQPGETLRRTLQAGEAILGLAEVIRHSDVMLPNAPEGARSVRARITEDKITADVQSVAPGPVELEITNASERLACVCVFGLNAAIIEATKTARCEPYLTGSRVLASQTFRQLFRTEVIQGSEGLGVKDVTLLFTDLKGSTALYERIGDLQAFALVRAHFDRIANAVQRNNGAVVKTIGDAVMAVFVSPIDAVRAALRMQAEIERFNQEHGVRDLILKIGIHSGASIAVTLNESLDYFGQTVNVAARVQAYAEADEICLTDEVLEAPSVREFLGSHAVSSEVAQLKGIARAMRVHRVQPDIAKLAA